MAYNRNQARPLLTKQELDLFEASLSDRIGSLSAVQLRAKIDRARGLADKYRDLFRRQARSTRQKTGTGRGASGAANERTDKKARIFGEALDRFETQLAKVEAKKAAAGRRKTPPTRASARASSKKVDTRADRRTSRAARKSDDAAASRKQDTTRTSRNTKISAHVSGQGRRNQARRDGRR
jgi:hypothetical protein